MHPRVSEAEIFAAVQSCIAEYGASGFTVEQVAKRAGLTRVQLYNRFGNKNSLVRSFLVDYARGFKRASMRRLMAAEVLPDAISLELLAGIRRVAADPYFRMLILPAALGEFEAEIASSDVMSIGLEQWMPALERGLQEKQLRADLVPEQTAQWLVFTEISLLIAVLNFEKSFDECDAFIAQFVRPLLQR